MVHRASFDGIENLRKIRGVSYDCENKKLNRKKYNLLKIFLSCYVLK